METSLLQSKTDSYKFQQVGFISLFFKRQITATMYI